MIRKLPHIHQYAAKGDIAGIKSELDRGTPVDLRDSELGWTPLMWAANAPAARLLIERGADVNAMAEDSPVLHFALRSGNCEKVEVLLDAGADMRYMRSHGYDALIDAMYNSLSEAERLPLLSLLIARGVNLNGVSSYGESALSIASRTGQFDAIRFLLDAGADPKPLEWTPLMHALALGSLEDVERELAQGADLSARDYWSRTPWLLSLQTGDVRKASRLLDAGADRRDRGRCGKTPLMYPAEMNDADMLRWLLAKGFPPDEVDEFGHTALMTAGSAECLRVLIDAGADVHYQSGSDSYPPIGMASSLAIVRLLVEAGADLNDISNEMRAALTKLPHDGVLDVSRQTYLAQKHRRFGTKNPELMNLPFWMAMIRNGEPAYAARQYFDDTESPEPVWCFQRFGKSLAELPDGRIIEIGGEHEDYYDPDFCIYNDVVVHHGDGTFEIYGYPKECFPPTDFHTATLLGRWIYIIGSLGYRGERQYGCTQVYRLNIDTLAMERLDTTGTPPGWISRHKAKLIGDGQIRISGGKVCAWANGEETYLDNTQEYVLNLHDLTWRRLPSP